MPRSLGLSAYRALSRRGATPLTPDWPPRPLGELVWFNAQEADSLARVQALAKRLASTRYGVTVLITSPNIEAIEVHKDLIFAPTPTDHPDAANAFISYWAPDVAVWFWGDMAPNLVLCAQESGADMILADAAKEGFETRRSRWLPDLTRQTLSQFDHIFVRSPDAQARLIQLGCSGDTLEEVAPLMKSGQPLPARRSDVSALNEALGKRPVWCALGVSTAEVSAVLAAHRTAQRMSHRLFLIFEPREEEAHAAIKAACQKSKLRYQNWSEGALPDDNTTVLLADTQDEAGLWLRVSPVTFFAGSLAPGYSSQDPFSAAALGSAILYGPHVGGHLDTYSRLAAEGAARIVNDADSLGAAVTRLIAPDQAAKMAMAGWEVVTQGASTTNRIIDVVQSRLNARQDTQTKAQSR